MMPKTGYCDQYSLGFGCGQIIAVGGRSHRNEYVSDLSS